MKPLVLTFHALVERIRAYGLGMEDVERAARTPDWTEPDPRPGVERRFLARQAASRHPLRVVVIEEEDHIRVLSAHPDRKARPPNGAT